jgi:hypothetical protein
MKKIFLILSLFISVVGLAQTGLNPAGSSSIANINEAIKGAVPATETSSNVYAGFYTGLTNVTDKAYSVKFPTANSGSVTFNLNASTDITLKKFSSGSLVNLASGDISAGETKRLRYNGTYLVIEGGSGGGSGTVSTVSVTTANGVSGSVANATTTPAITLTLGTITPSSVNGVVVSGSSAPTLAVTGTTSISGTHSGTSSGNNTGDQTNITGNAATATTVTTTINSGVTGTTQSANASGTLMATAGYADAKLTTANTQTANYTFVLSDVGKVVRMNLTGTANTLTLPTNASVPYPLYTWLYYEQVNTGITTLVAPSGGTATPPTGGSLITPVQGVLCAIYKIGTDAWEVYNGTTVPGQALTLVNDTNVTLTASGTPATSLLQGVTITAGWQSTVGVLRGGTGTGTAFTDGSVVFAGLAGAYAQDNATFFWDRTNKRLGIGNATPTSKLEISAGSTSANSAPIELNTGARETTPRAGLIQYTTPQLFFTNGGLIDQEVQLVQQSRVSTQFDATSNTTLANVTGLTSSLAAGKIYRFNAVLFTTSNIAGGIKTAIAGTATATSIIYESVVVQSGVMIVPGTTRAAALATTTGDVTAVTVARINITGLIVCNAAGTLTVQFAQNASNGTASSVLVGSNFQVNETP